MFQRKTIRLDRQLLNRAAAAAEAAGYASTLELIEHALRQAVEQIEFESAQAASDRAAVDQQLRGLGYLE